MSRRTEHRHGDAQRTNESAPDIDFDAEHDPERARRVSNVRLRRDGAALQRRQPGGDSTREDVHENAARGVSSPSTTMPHAAQIQASFGPEHDISNIEAHVGDGSASAMGAQAYASGNHVVFDKEPDVHTAAHEAAHVMQQRQGVQLYGGVGRGDDSHERRADLVADRVVAGQPAGDLLGPAAPATARSGSQPVQMKTDDSTSHTDVLAQKYDRVDERWEQQRDAIADPTGAHVLDGGSLDATELGGKDAGEAGYGAKLGNAGTRRAEKALLKGEYGVVAPLVQPHTLDLERALAENAQWIEKMETAKEEKKYTPSVGRDLVTLGLTQTRKDPAWVTQEKENSIAQSGAQLALCERHMFEQWHWVNSYNSWAPIANQAGAARADLIESAALMGFDLGKTDDMVRFVEGIEHGLDNANQLVDAKVLGPDGDVSWSGRQDYKGNVGAGPEMKGESISPLFDELREKHEDVTNKQHGVYRDLLGARTEVLEAHKFSKEAKVNEINGVITFWTNIAGVVDQAWGPAQWLAQGKAGDKINEFAGEWRARRSGKQAADSAKAGKHASSRLYMERSHMARGHITGADGLPANDMESRVGALEAGAAPQPPGSLGGMAPTLSGVVGALANMAFDDQLKQLTGEITSLSKQVGAQQAVAKLTTARESVEGYRAARRQLADVARRIEVEKVANREAQYVDAGDSLDRYARAHSGELKREKLGHVAPKDNKHEMYSSLMVMVAKVRAFMLYADTARETFPYNDFVNAALKLSNERRNPKQSPELQAAPKSGHWTPPKLPRTTKEEDKQVWEPIDGAYATVFGFSERARIQFAGVEEKVSALLQKMKGVEAKNNDVAENKY